MSGEPTGAVDLYWIPMGAGTPVARRCGRWFEVLCAARDRRSRCDLYHSALVVTTDEALGVYGVLDCGAWVNNFMLAAAGAGIACIAQAALAAHPGLLRKFFGIDGDRRIVCGMSFGYENAQHPANKFRTSRATKEEVATWTDT